MDKFLILGSGSRLAKHFIGKYKNIAIPISRFECDITKPADLKRVLSGYEYKYILNCAAVTNIDFAESHEKETYFINYEAPRQIQKIAGTFGKKIIFISSNYAVNPINVYGKSKQKMEALAREDTLIIRTDFYDEQNFIIKNLGNGNKIKCYENAYFNPVSVNRLVKEIMKNRDKSGLLNIFSNYCLTYLDFALLAEQKMNTGKNLVSPMRLTDPIRPLNGCVKSDISIDIDTDLKDYANYQKI